MLLRLSGAWLPDRGIQLHRYAQFRSAFDRIGGDFAVVFIVRLLPLNSRVTVKENCIALESCRSRYFALGLFSTLVGVRVCQSLCRPQLSISASFRDRRRRYVREPSTSTCRTDRGFLIVLRCAVVDETPARLNSVHSVNASMEKVKGTEGTRGGFVCEFHRSIDLFIRSRMIIWTHRPKDRHVPAGVQVQSCERESASRHCHFPLLPFPRRRRDSAASRMGRGRIYLRH